MDQAWLQEGPHLAPLARALDAILKLADDHYKQGRASGDAVDYSEFEERVAHATAKIEQDVHPVALSRLDVDVSFIRVWGKHYAHDPLRAHARGGRQPRAADTARCHRIMQRLRDDVITIRHRTGPAPVVLLGTLAAVRAAPQREAAWHRGVWIRICAVEAGDIFVR